MSTSTSSTALFSNAIALSIAVLYTLAGQAHFTSRFTPGLAANVDKLTPNSHKALSFIPWTYPQCKAILGAFDFVAAVCLVRRKTRNFGLLLAVLGFGGGVYGQWYCGEDLGQVGAMFGFALLGFVTAPKRRNV